MGKKILSLIIAGLFVVGFPSVAQAAEKEPSIWICNDEEADVLRLYYAIFNRPHDPVGGGYWRDEFRNNISKSEISYWMSQSPEYDAKYKSIKTNDQFIEKLYRNIFKRKADAKGKAYWLDEMDKGFERHLVVRWMAESSELKIRHDYRINSTCPSKRAVTKSVPANRVSTRDFYSNCSEVEAVLGRPILVSDRGYSTKLDRDEDGTGCESVAIAYVVETTYVGVPPIYIYR